MRRTALAFYTAAFILGCSSPANRTGTAVIGAGGGTLQLDEEVTLVVPAGALDADQTLTITRTDEAAPDGWIAHSPIYRFTPRGIVFAAPVSVTIAHEGAAEELEIAWTAMGESDWRPIPTSLASGRAVGFVTHFSGGFVGRQSADDAGVDELDAAMDASPGDSAVDATTDGSAVDDAGSDGSLSDAALAFCPSTEQIDTFSATGWVTTDASESDPCSEGCPEVSGRSAALVTLSAPMQATMWFSHTLSPSDSFRATISGDCRAPGAACVTVFPVTYPMIRTYLLPAGTYQFVTCGRRAGVALEPPPPPPTNTSCATAAMMAPSYAQRRATTMDPLYFAFDSLAGSNAAISVRSSMNQGQMSLSLRTVCDDPASEVATYDVPYVLGSSSGVTAFSMVGRPAGRYYIVATDVPPGLEFEIRQSF